MKFKVRAGFVVHDTKLVTVGEGDEATTQTQTNTYYPGKAVEFDEATARDHLHKLEPADSDAKAWLAEIAPPAAEAAVQGGVDSSSAIAELTKQVSALAAIVGKMVAPAAAAAPAK